jgi:hypothetical protein
MAGTPMPMPWFTGLDASGAPVGGGLLYTYAAGTTTPLATYTDSTLGTPNANPVVLDSAGRAAVFLPSGVAYKFELRTAAGVVIRTQDNVASVPQATSTTQNVEVAGVAGEALTLNDFVYLSDGTGGRVAGRFYKVSGSTAAYSLDAVVVGFALQTVAGGDAVTVRLGGQVTGFAGLTAGVTYYGSTTPGALVSVAPAFPRLAGRADSTTSLIIGSGIASIQETAIVDGALLARLAAAETVAAQWLFNAGVRLGQTLTPTQLTGNVNDWAPTDFASAFCLRISADATRQVTGLAGGVDGRLICVVNVGSFTVEFACESASSAAGNRFAASATVAAGGNYNLRAIGGGSGGNVSFWFYDGTSARWRPFIGLV